MLIASQAQLEHHAGRWQTRPWLTVDTEFVREDSYWPRLSLIQIGDGQTAACIDTLAVSDLAPVEALFDDPAIVKVFHSPSQDLEIFVHRFGRCPKPLFDTQLAATLLGIAEQPGYAPLVEKMLGVSVDKSLSRTPWLRRPLAEAEIAYAADDVRWLAAIYPVLRDRLQRVGRFDWLVEDCARMAEARHYQPQPEREWRRLKGLARLEPRAQHVAARLAAWRERVAVERDRPRRWILADEALYALAERLPETFDQIGALHVLPGKTLERHAEALLACVCEGPPEPPEPLARDERAEPDLKALLQRLREPVRAAAESLKLPPGLLAPRADLEALAAQGPSAEVPVLAGWRREVVGERLLALLAVG